jgi:hypothetical protein
LSERSFVEIVKFTPDWKSVSQLADTDWKSFETLSDIVGRCLTFEGRIHGEHDFVDAAF